MKTEIRETFTEVFKASFKPDKDDILGIFSLVSLIAGLFLLAAMLGS